MCIESAAVQQNDGTELAPARLGIVPNLNFNCDGKITGVIARVIKRKDEKKNFTDYPYFNIWRPSPTKSMAYTNIGEVQLQESQVSQCNDKRLCIANISLVGGNVLVFQSGDVVGFYHPFNTSYQVRMAKQRGYTLYYSVEISHPTSLIHFSENQKQRKQKPLIEFMIGNL